tara:strand:+ start:2613 stop:3332 length:720 start_codon:yes stop_codon:yes gene_type:complete
MKLHDQFFYYISALNQHQNVTIFTLMFTDPQLDRLAPREKRRPKRDPKDKKRTKRVPPDMRSTKMISRNRIAQRFRDYLPGVPALFVIEFTEDEFIHIHGALDAGSLSESYISSALAKISGDEPLISTGIDRRFIAEHAVKFSAPDWNEKFRRNTDVRASQKTGDNSFGPHGWANYMLKDTAKTSAHLGMESPPMYVSRDVTAAAKEFHKSDVDFARAYAGDQTSDQTIRINTIKPRPS